jgi:NTE family protein
MDTRASDIFPRARTAQLLRAVLGANGLNDDSAVRRYFTTRLPPNVRKFGDLPVKLYLTAADFQTGKLFLYGDLPEASIIEAALCSSALPVVWDPQIIHGHQFVDGGVAANLPTTIAIDKGATEIYALDLGDPGPYPIKKGIVSIASHAIGVLLHQQVQRDVQRAMQTPNVKVHYLNLGDIFAGIPLQDFTKTAEMIERGYRRTKEYLASPTPNVMPKPKPAPGVAFGPGGAPGDVVPEGAVPYEPPV